MSAISNVYSTMLTRIAAAISLASQDRIPNPYRLELNGGPYLARGFAVLIGPAVNTNRVIGSKVSIQRQMDVVLTRQFFALASDPAAKSETELALLEDQILIIKDFESDSTLDGTVAKTSYAGDSGIQSILGDDEQFISVTTSFQIEYFENF